MRRREGAPCLPVRKAGRLQKEKGPECLSALRPFYQSSDLKLIA